MEVLKSGFLAKVAALPRPIQTKDLMELVNAEEWNSRISADDTLNYAFFFGGALRYFFTFYEDGVAYRMCTIDNNYHRIKDSKSRGYIGFACNDIAERVADGYCIGDYESNGQVEVIVQKKKM